jgi:electron transport complex protein RnfA
MEYLASLISIMISAVFTENMVLSKSIGICPFLGVSKKTNSAVGMGLAVTFVIALCSVISYALYTWVLIPLNLDYLSLIVFILVIAALVQFLEIVIKKFTPALYNAMGLYLPLITTNCAVLFTANFVALNWTTNAFGEADLFKVFLHGLFVGIGFLAALVMMAGIRERLEKSDIPKSFRGFPIALLAAGIISLAFYGLRSLDLSSILS